MHTIVVTPKFTKENILSINLENLIEKNFRLCFSLVYSIVSIENATISKQVGRYYEFLINPKNINSLNFININLQLQTPKIGSYNKSCGPEGLFILDENKNIVQVEIKKLTFDNPIKKKNIKKLSSTLPFPLYRSLQKVI